jgi:hypothetical protein
MKKLTFLSALMFAFGMMANAQTQTFFTPVGYRGAFAPAPATPWTAGWTNWDPQNTNYGTPTVTLSGNITANRTLNASTVYSISGVVYIDSGVTLTIPAGTVLRGNSTVSNSSILVKKGGRINANGTAQNPIVFTSDKAVGSRGLGDWGGIMICGRAVQNQGVSNIEGLADDPQHKYGGNDDNDNSGTLRYVRIEYGGYVFAANKEINGLTMGAVGRGTTIEYVQCSYINDDSFEWFGGTVNCKYLVAYRGLDDDFDTDFGYSGNVQFALSVRDPQTADNTWSLSSGGSTSEGFESDNDANGSYAFPRTSATFSNVTLIGPYRGNNLNSIHPGFRRGARIRRNSALRIINTVWTDWATGVMLDGSATTTNINANRVDSSALVQGNVIANYKLRVGEVATGSSFNAGVYLGNRNDTINNYNLMTNAYNFANPDYRPASGSILAYGSTFSLPDAGSSNYIAQKTNCVIASVTGAAISTATTNWCRAFGGTDTVTFTMPLLNNVSTYTWSIPNGTILSGQGSPMVKVLFSPGAPNRTVTCNASNFCSSSVRSYSIRANAPTMVPVLVIKTLGVCAIRGTATNATYTILPILGATSYLWTVPAGATIVSGQGTTSIDVNFAAGFTSGVMSVVGVSNCGNTPSKSINIGLLEKPTIGGPTSVCPGNQETFGIGNVTGATHYRFNLPPGLALVSQINNFAIVTNTGAFTSGKIRCQVYTSNCGVSPPSIFSVNTAACRNMNDLSVAIYPNPSNGQFEVRFSTATDGSLEILDLTGKVVYAKNFNTNVEAVNANFLQNGIYLVKVSANGITQVSKISIAK